MSMPARLHGRCWTGAQPSRNLADAMPTHHRRKRRLQGVIAWRGRQRVMQRCQRFHPLRRHRLLASGRHFHDGFRNLHFNADCANLPPCLAQSLLQFRQLLLQSGCNSRVCRGQHQLARFKPQHSAPLEHRRQHNRAILVDRGNAQHDWHQCCHFFVRAQRIHCAQRGVFFASVWRTLRQEMARSG